MNTNVKIFADILEDTAKAQIEKIASHPAFADAKIRIMPDVHAGKGCVCGFTADLGDKVVPNLVGVDLGCGMHTVCLGKIDINYAKLDFVIRACVPSGMNVHASPIVTNWFNAEPRNCIAGFSEKDCKYFDCSVGSLGGGNHFCEIDVDDEGNKYLIIHTGSRNFGKKVCEYWQKVAVDNMPSGELSDEDIDSIFS